MGSNGSKTQKSNMDALLWLLPLDSWYRNLAFTSLCTLALLDLTSSVLLRTKLGTSPLLLELPSPILLLHHHLMLLVWSQLLDGFKSSSLLDGLNLLLTNASG